MGTPLFPQDEKDAYYKLKRKISRKTSNESVAKLAAMLAHFDHTIQKLQQDPVALHPTAFFDVHWALTETNSNAEQIRSTLSCLKEKVDGFTKLDVNDVADFLQEQIRLIAFGDMSMILFYMEYFDCLKSISASDICSSIVRNIEPFSDLMYILEEYKHLVVNPIVDACIFKLILIRVDQLNLRCSIDTVLTEIAQLIDFFLPITCVTPQDTDSIFRDVHYKCCQIDLLGQAYDFQILFMYVDRGFIPSTTALLSAVIPDCIGSNLVNCHQKYQIDLAVSIIKKVLSLKAMPELTICFDTVSKVRSDADAVLAADIYEALLKYQSAGLVAEHFMSGLYHYLISFDDNQIRSKMFQHKISADAEDDLFLSAIHLERIDLIWSNNVKKTAEEKLMIASIKRQIQIDRLDYLLQIFKRALEL